MLETMDELIGIWHAAGKLPGIKANEEILQRAVASGLIHFELRDALRRADPEAYLYLPLLIRKKEDDTLYYYIFRRKNQSADWSLESAWKILPNGKQIALSK